jgi:hypothetical protein
MDNLQVAEWILSSVLPPDRAAAAVGDFAEEAARRGSLWFWSCVFRTVITQIRSDLSANPVSMARLGLMGFAMNALVVVGSVLPLSALIRTIRHSDIGYYQHGWLWTVFLTDTSKDPTYLPHWEIRWSIWAVCWLIYIARLFRTGSRMARQTSGREVGAAVSIALTGWVIFLGFDFLSRSRIIITVGPGVIALGIFHDMILMAGAIRARLESIESRKR